MLSFTCVCKKDFKPSEKVGLVNISVQATEIAQWATDKYGCLQIFCLHLWIEHAGWNNVLLHMQVSSEAITQHDSYQHVLADITDLAVSPSQ